jgi:hypothetical protein
MPVLLLAVLSFLSYLLLETHEILQQPIQDLWWLKLSHQCSKARAKESKNQIAIRLACDKVIARDDNLSSAVEKTQDTPINPFRAKKKSTKPKNKQQLILASDSPLEIGKLSLVGILQATPISQYETYQTLFQRLLYRVYNGKKGISEELLYQLSQTLLHNYQSNPMPIKTPHDLLHLLEEEPDLKHLLLSLLKGNQGPNISDPFPPLTHFITTPHLLGIPANQVTSIHFHFADVRLLESLHADTSLTQWLSQEREDLINSTNQALLRKRIPKDLYLKQLLEKTKDKELVKSAKMILSFDIKKTPQKIQSY